MGPLFLEQRANKTRQNMAPKKRDGSRRSEVASARIGREVHYEFNGQVEFDAASSEYDYRCSSAPEDGAWSNRAATANHMWGVRGAGCAGRGSCIILVRGSGANPRVDLIRRGKLGLRDAEWDRTARPCSHESCHGRAVAMLWSMPHHLQPQSD